MAKVQHGLGKGLSALLGDDAADLREIRKPVGYINKDVVGTTPEKEVTADVLRIPVDLIEPNPFQPRMSFGEEALLELADSIRTFGLIQPITVRKKGSKYQMMAIVENIQRENLDPIEVAMSYQRLMEECRLTQEQMADRVGKKRASVANQLRLLKLPAKVQHDLKVGLVSVGHAKVLLGVDDPKAQEMLCDLIVRRGLSVRQLEEKVRALEKGLPQPEEKEPQELPDMYYRLLENVGRYFGDNISLKRSPAGKGSITIRFDSDEQMERFLQALDPNRG